MATKKFIIGKVGYSSAKITAMFNEIQTQVENNVKDNLDDYLDELFPDVEEE